MKYQLYAWVHGKDVKIGEPRSKQECDKVKKDMKHCILHPMYRRKVG